MEISFIECRLLEAMSCNDAPEGELACLQNIPQEDLLNAFVFRPRGVIDGGRSSNPVLPDAPEVLLSRGQFNKVCIFVNPLCLDLKVEVTYKQKLLEM